VLEIRIASAQLAYSIFSLCGHYDVACSQIFAIALCALSLSLSLSLSYLFVHYRYDWLRVHACLRLLWICISTVCRKVQSRWGLPIKVSVMHIVLSRRVFAGSHLKKSMKIKEEKIKKVSIEGITLWMISQVCASVFSWSYKCRITCTSIRKICVTYGANIFPFCCFLFAGMDSKFFLFAIRFFILI
jgi:hypothetical protein